MFSNLLFLLLVLLSASLAPEVTTPYWDVSPAQSLWLGTALYGLLLISLVAQVKVLPLRYGSLTILAQLEILLFLGFFLFFLDGMHIFGAWSTLHVFVVLSLYSGALGLFYSFAYFRAPLRGVVDRGSFVDGQLRLTMPFAVPYLLLGVLSDLLTVWVPLDAQVPSTSAVVFLFFVGFMLLMMALVPVLVVLAWKCQPLPPGDIKEGLEALCRRAGFRYREICSWTILRHTATAAILGVFPQYRYVMFTDLMLRELSPKALQAVLAHEIGHSRHYHLLLYPFVLLGGLVLAGLFGWIVIPALAHWMDLIGQGSLIPLASLVPYCIIFAVYFRFVFGYFSRLFERQADLSVISLGVDPQEMVEALHKVAVLCGHIHDQPSWHHFSIRQRIEALEFAAVHPASVESHSQRVRSALMIYGSLLLIGLVMVLAPTFPATPGFKQVALTMEQVAISIDSLWNR